jgi:iron complex outermembrane receptor protein
MGKLRVSIPVWGDRSYASFALRHLSRRTTLSGAIVEPATVVGVTLLERIAPSIELTATVGNLFNQRYADPASDEHVQDSIPQNGRTFRAAVRWTFFAR